MPEHRRLVCRLCLSVSQVAASAAITAQRRISLPGQGSMSTSGTLQVQCGFGRVGSHFWGFELQSVVPDMVTLGKPIGNGFPMGAVVMSSHLAQGFSNGMEYFNTCGGCTAAAAAGELCGISCVWSLDLQLPCVSEVSDITRRGVAASSLSQAQLCRCLCSGGMCRHGTSFSVTLLCARA